MIIQYFTDNDLYKFTTMYAIQKLYPWARVKYRFFNRANTNFPEGFSEKLKQEIQNMSGLSLSNEEEQFLRNRCYYFDPVYIDFLKGFRFNPDEVTINQKNGELNLEIEGYWFRTVLWEVPLMAIISELYFKMMGDNAIGVSKKARNKAEELVKMKAVFSDFGTRRRFSFAVHEEVLQNLKNFSGSYLTGTSNVYLAMKYNLTPIGTHPHEWFMFHAAHFGYRSANYQALRAWANVYNGALGIALTDTFTTENFFESFELKYAKLFDGLRWDSGDPLEFTEKAIRFYESNRIDPKSKTIVYSDSLNLETVKKIKGFVGDRIRSAYGIGTYFTNDVGVKPLNMVIKLTHAADGPNRKYIPTIKLSDVPGKNTGDLRELENCKTTLNLN
jgi:nicotinate phosphoribosyltransferase